MLRSFCHPACHRQKVFIFFHYCVVAVTVLKKITMMVSTPDRDSQRVRESDSILFTDGGYVIMEFRVKNIT